MGLPPRHTNKKTRQQPSPPVAITVPSPVPPTCEEEGDEQEVTGLFPHRDASSSNTRRSACHETNYNCIVENQRHPHYHHRPQQQQKQLKKHHVMNSFQKALYEKGLQEVEQEGDGNCLFRAVGLQVYGDSDSHMEVRRRCMDFMAKEQAHFAQFVPTQEPFQSYIERKRQDGVHGNNPEIQAISELYNRPVQVYLPSHGATPINIFQSEYKTCDIPIRLAYHDGNHYNAIVDPLLPTAGLGLGLPGLEPGLADKLQMQRAKQESDRIFMNEIARQTHDMELKRAMEESSKLSSMDYYWMRKKRALEYSDLEETDFELEQMALLSSLQESCPKTVVDTSASASKEAVQETEEEGQKMSSGNDGVNQSSDCTKTSTTCHAAASPTGSVAAAATTAAKHNDSEDRDHVQQQQQQVLDQGLLDSSPTNHKIMIRQDEEEYPRTVQELVMNGFELSKVLKAYELIGDNFDDLLSYLMNI